MQAEVATSREEVSIAAFWIHREACGDLNRGHRREPGINNSDKSGGHLSCEVVIAVSCVNTSLREIIR